MTAEEAQVSREWGPLARTNAIRLTVAHSDEDTLFYMGLGFGF